MTAAPARRAGRARPAQGKRCSPKSSGSELGLPSGSPVVVRPLTPARWKDLEALFGPKGACGGCWCLWWRVPRRQFDAGKGDGNHREMRELVRRGPPPGLLAYAGGAPAGRRRATAEPVGWIALAPRTQYPRLAGSRILAPVDEALVWSVTCFFIARAWRGRGVSRALLEGAAEFARKRGGRILEGYPVDPREGRQADAFLFTGIAATFRAAGFTECARRSATRPIMRRSL